MQAQQVVKEITTKKWHQIWVSFGLTKDELIATTE